MASFSGPEIVNTNLIFHIDANNVKKSYKGKPLTNYYPDLFTSQSMRSHTKHFWTGKYWVVNDTYSDPGIPGPEGVFLGKMAKHTSGALSSSWSGNSYGYMLRDISDQTSGEYYSVSCYVYVSNDCNITAVPAIIEQESSGETSVLSGEPTEYNMNNKGTWQRIGKRAISDGTVRYIPVYPRKTGVTNGVFSGFFMWGGVQVEEGSHVNRLVSADDGVSSRSTTGAIVDLTGRTIVTTGSSIEYSPTTKKFRFSPSNNNSTLEVPLSTSLNKLKGTLNIWAKADAYAGSNGLFVNRDNAGANASNWMWLGTWSSGGILYFRLGNGSACCNNDLTIGSFNTNYMPVNTWTNICVTWESDDISQIFINGNLVATRTFSSIPDTNPTSTGRIGLGHGSGSSGSWDGEIGTFMIYDDVLTSAQVKQNYESLRGKFGV